MNKSPISHLPKRNCIFAFLIFQFLNVFSCKPSIGNHTNAIDSVYEISISGKADLYPEPLDISSVVGLDESPYFDIKVNGENGFVYHGKEIRDEFEHVKQGNSISYQGVSYFNFSFSNEVEIEILGTSNAKNWNIMSKDKINFTDNTTSIKFTLQEPQKFIVSADIDGLTQFFIISAEEPEDQIPAVGDSGVLFLGPGIHKYGQSWDPFVDGIHTVYIAGGAVVEATINSRNKKGVKLLGRGILAQSFVTHAEEAGKEIKEQEWDADWLGVVFSDSEDIEIDGIAIINSPSYQLEVANCKNVTINNVKLCGFGEHNNDGLHTYSTNVKVENSFIASNDDRICITGLFDKNNGPSGIGWDGSNELTGVSVSDITIKNMVFWGLDNNGGDIMLTWNGSGYAKDVLIEDVVSLSPTNKAFLAARHGGSADIYNIKIKDVILHHGNLFDIEIGESNYQGKGGGKLRDVTLENITIQASISEIGKQLIGLNTESYIKGITLKNINGSDGRLSSIDELYLKSNEFVFDVHVEE